MAPASPGHGYFLGSGTRWTAAVAFCAIYAPTRPPSTAQVPTLTPRRRQVQHPPPAKCSSRKSARTLQDPKLHPSPLPRAHVRRLTGADTLWKKTKKRFQEAYSKFYGI